MFVFFKLPPTSIQISQCVMTALMDAVASASSPTHFKKRPLTGSPAGRRSSLTRCATTQWGQAAVGELEGLLSRFQFPQWQSQVSDATCLVCVLDMEQNKAGTKWPATGGVGVAEHHVWLFFPPAPSSATSEDGGISMFCSGTSLKTCGQPPA